MSQPNFDERRRLALFNHHLTHLDWCAMVCPGYHIHGPLEKVASWSVGENDPEIFTADEYLAALNGLIDRGLLAMYSKADAARELARLTASGIPFEPNEVPLPGTVGFTEAGWRTHRQVKAEIWGEDWCREGEILTFQNEQDQTVQIIGHHSDILQHRIQSSRRHGDLPRVPDQVITRVSIGAFTSSGPWWASRFLKYDEGVSVTLAYESVPEWTVHHPELDMEYTVTSLSPLFAHGVAGGKGFVFGEKTSIRDDVIYFEWYFREQVPVEVQVRPEATLTGRPPYKGGFVVPANGRKAHEARETGCRTQSLTPESADEIICEAIRKWTRSAA